MKILFAINEDLDDSLETRILNKYKEQNGYGFEFDKATNLNEIIEALENNVSYDLLVLNEELRINNPVTLEQIKQIKNVSKETRIILIFNSENKDDTFISTLHNLGIHDFVSSEEITMEKIIDLIMGRETILTKNKSKEISVDFNKIIPKSQNFFKNKTLQNINKTKKNLIIGVGGVSSGSGTTHTALGLATYFKEMANEVAIVEFNNKPQLSRLMTYTDRQDKDYFSINKLDIYFQKSMKQNLNNFNQTILKLKSNGYNYIIIDFGRLKGLNDKGISQRNSSYNEIYRTDYQILCLNGSSWKWEDINFYRHDDFVEVEPYINNWILTINLINDSFFKNIKKEIKKITVLENIEKAPLYLNPFDMNEENLKYFENLTKHMNF